MAEAGKARESTAQDRGADPSGRRRRVRRLKRLILGTIAALILVPICLCVFLAVRVASLQSAVDALSAQLNALEQEIAESARLSDAEAESAEILTDPVGSAGGQPEVAEVEPEADAYAHRVYLTFDDGPSANTDEILDILAEYNVKATFFVVGKEDAHSQEMLRRIVDEGHTLGMHSYSHKYAELYASEEAFTEDLEKLRSYLYDVTGVESKLYRFPGGSSNTVSSVDMSVLAEVLEEQGITYFDWNIATGDAASRILDADTLAENATAELAGYTTAVILMHDSADKTTTVEALPRIIETIQAMDDTVILPITEDTEPVHHVEPQTE